MLETTKIHFVAGVLDSTAGLVTQRPFRSPHPTISDAGLIGGIIPRPGEVSLAHNGLLFLDEPPECRATCSKRCESRDRIDIHIEAPAFQHKELRGGSAAEGSAEIRLQGDVARVRQRDRFQKSGEKIFSNGQMCTRQIRAHCELNPDAEPLPERAIEQQGLTARAHDRILRAPWPAWRDRTPGRFSTCGGYSVPHFGPQLPGMNEPQIVQVEEQGSHLHSNSNGAFI